MSKVVGLRGQEIWDRRTPVKSVVSALEELLEAARSGEIGGIVICSSYHDESVGWQRLGNYRNYTMAGALEAAKLAVLKADE